MKCPLFCQGLTVRLLKDPSIVIDCLEKECARWDTTFNWYVEQTKAHALYAIATELAEIRKQMPLA